MPCLWFLHAPDPSASPFPADLLPPMRIHQILAQRGAVTGSSNKIHPKSLPGKLKQLLTNVIKKICSGIAKSLENDVDVTSVCLQTLQIPLDVLAAAWCLPQVSIFSNLVFG